MDAVSFHETGQIIGLIIRCSVNISETLKPYKKSIKHIRDSLETGAINTLKMQEVSTLQIAH